MMTSRPARICDALEKLLKDKGVVPDAHTSALPIAEASGIYYHSLSNKFYIPRHGGGFTTTPWSGCQAAIEASVGPSTPLKPEVMRAVRAHVIKHRAFDGCINLAGYPPGLLDLPDGDRVLVPRGMKVIEPVAGDPGPMLEFISNLVGAGVQYQTLLSWLKLSLVAGLRCKEVGVMKANPKPAQVLIMVGPPGCGKSLFTRFLGELFGDSRADPYPFMAGATAFNDNLAQAVLLVMDDVTESVMPRARHSLSQHLRQHTVNPFFQVHARYCRPFVVQVFHRCVMLANWDSLSVLPAMDPDFLDKVILLQGLLSEHVCKYRDANEQAEWVERIRKSLPAFVHYLVHEFEIPEELRDGRYGVKSFHDKRLMAELRNEDNYAQLIDDLRTEYVLRGKSIPAGRLRAPAGGGAKAYVWTGAGRDFREIVFHLPEARGWRQDFSSSHAAGMMLKKMADQMPEVVASNGSSGGTKRWMVNLGLDALTPGEEQMPEAELFKLRSKSERTRQWIKEDAEESK